MKQISFVFLVILAACSNQPRNIQISSNYEYGFSISETPELIKELVKIGDFCIKLNPAIDQQKPLFRKGGDSYYHKFSVYELTELINKFNGCNDSYEFISLDQIYSEINYFARMRYNGYTVYIKILGSYECLGSKHKLKTETSSGLENHSLIGDKKVNALIASSVVLIFYKAITKVHDQMVLDCGI